MLNASKMRHRCPTEFSRLRSGVVGYYCLESREKQSVTADLLCWLGRDTLFIGARSRWWLDAFGVLQVSIACVSIEPNHSPRPPHDTKSPRSAVALVIGRNIHVHQGIRAGGNNAGDAAEDSRKVELTVGPCCPESRMTNVAVYCLPFLVLRRLWIL
jgi:hypothetical protein